LIRHLLLLIALGNIGFGIWVMIEPRMVIDQMLEWQGSEPYSGVLSSASLGEMRALMGGLVAMLGVVTLRALWNPAYAAWLQPMAWCYLGTALARGSSLFLDGGSYSRYTIISAAIEGGTALLLGVHSQRMLREAEQEFEEDDEEYDEEYEDEDEELA
jgi:hypothetical protein